LLISNTKTETEIIEGDFQLESAWNDERVKDKYFKTKIKPEKDLRIHIEYKWKAVI
jgi:hypothetical protein